MRDDRRAAAAGVENDPVADDQRRLAVAPVRRVAAELLHDVDRPDLACRSPRRAPRARRCRRTRRRDRRPPSACRAGRRPVRCGTAGRWPLPTAACPLAASNAMTYSTLPRAPSVNSRPLADGRTRNSPVPAPVARHSERRPVGRPLLQQPGFRRVPITIRPAPLRTSRAPATPPAAPSTGGQARSNKSNAAHKIHAVRHRFAAFSLQPSAFGYRLTVTAHGSTVNRSTVDASRTSNGLNQTAFPAPAAPRRNPAGTARA